MKILTEASLKWILSKIKKLELKDFEPEKTTVSPDGKVITRINGNLKEVTTIESESRLVVATYNIGTLLETRVITIEQTPDGGKTITETVEGAQKKQTVLTPDGSVVTEYNEKSKIVTEIISETEIHEKTYEGETLVSTKVISITPDGQGGQIIQEKII